METLILSSKDFKTLEISIEYIRRGEVIAVPTETVYGLVCDWSNDKAIRKIYHLKGREFTKPLTAFCDSFEMIEELVKSIDNYTRKLIENFTPGPITFLMKRNKKVIDLSNARTNIIGIRIPDNKFVLDLISHLKKPLASTSANISGGNPLLNVGDLLNFFSGKIPLIVDGGKSKLGVASTIIDVTVHPPKIVREGALSSKKIKDVLELSN